jgi:hypothetical protein
MVGSRTIKALVALLISMTAGAGVLMVLEVAPASPQAQQLTALAEPAQGVAAVIHETSVPLQPIKWRHIIVYSSNDAGFMGKCHFVIAPDGSARPTELWKGQASGDHIYVPGRDFNRDSIGICLEGSFSYDDPTISQKQFDALMDLSRSLQQAFRITADRVYLESDLVPNSSSPGDAFPAGQFNAELLRGLR